MAWPTFFGDLSVKVVNGVDNAMSIIQIKVVIFKVHYNIQRPIVTDL